MANSPWSSMPKAFQLPFNPKPNPTRPPGQRFTAALTKNYNHRARATSGGTLQSQASNCLTY